MPSAAGDGLVRIVLRRRAGTDARGCAGVARAEACSVGARHRGDGPAGSGRLRGDHATGTTCAGYRATTGATWGSLRVIVPTGRCGAAPIFPAFREFRPWAGGPVAGRLVRPDGSGRCGTSRSTGHESAALRKRPGAPRRHVGPCAWSFGRRLATSASRSHAGNRAGARWGRCVAAWGDVRARPGRAGRDIGHARRNIGGRARRRLRHHAGPAPRHVRVTERHRGRHWAGSARRNIGGTARRRVRWHPSTTRRHIRWHPSTTRRHVRVTKRHRGRHSAGSARRNVGGTARRHVRRHPSTTRGHIRVALRRRARHWRGAM